MATCIPVIPGNVAWINVIIAKVNFIWDSTIGSIFSLSIQLQYVHDVLTMVLALSYFPSEKQLTPFILQFSCMA